MKLFSKMNVIRAGALIAGAATIWACGGGSTPYSPINNGGGGGGAPGFFLTATPNTRTVAPGGTATYTIGVRAGENGAEGVGMVDLTVQGSVTNATVSLNPQSLPVGGDATLTVQTSAGGGGEKGGPSLVGETPPGTYTLTIGGHSDNNLTASTTVTVVVTDPGGFTVSLLPTSQTIDNRGFDIQTKLPPGIILVDRATYVVRVQPQGGFTGVVNISVTGFENIQENGQPLFQVQAPGPFTFNTTNNTAAQQGNLTIIRQQNTTRTGPIPFTVRAVSGTKTAQATGEIVLRDPFQQGKVRR